MGDLHRDRIAELHDLGGAVMTTEAKVGSTVTVGPCELQAPEGKEFSHWNTECDGTGVSYSPGDSFTLLRDTVLYAIWRDMQ